MSLLATLTGLGTAVYLERARDAAEMATATAETTSPAAAAPIVPAAVVAANETHDPMSAAAAIPAPPSIEPRAGAAAPTAVATRNAESPEPHEATTSSPTTVAPPSSQVARLEVTPEPPARAATLSPTTAADAPQPATTTTGAATQSYWVEYGVYTNARGAKRLQQALADQGLKTVITLTHTPDGRPLVRVRSAPELDYGTAKAASENARQALKLSTLIHRGTPAREQGVAQAALAQASKPSATEGYWVQFGAFPHRPQAERLQGQLARGGIETAVSTMRGTSGRTLYWVRSLNLPDRSSALAVAGRGQEAGSADYLVGHSVARPGATAEPNRTENDVVRPGVRYHTAESLSLPFPAR
ncbi:MAG TPA: SPOR domain-containing protein [Stellaceae bacterium]|nr:SPOR domain-containing protein [Stellaceae bacterium]